MTWIDPKFQFSEHSFRNQLRSKSRNRRERMARIVATSAKRGGMRNDPLPRLLLDDLALEDLRLPRRAVRQLDTAHIREVANSISRLGFCVPMIVGKDNIVIDGAIRVEAARLLGLGWLSCVRIDHLSEDEQRVLRLAVNRLAEKGQWDLEELKIEFEELILTDAPIEIAGFAPDEIDQIVLERGGKHPRGGAARARA